MAVAAQKTPRQIDSDWDAQATQSAIDAARKVVNDGINGRAMVSSLSDIEWGWLVAAAIFGWIETKAKQAVAEGCGYDTAIRSMAHRDPAPWEAGAVATILPALGNLTAPWEKPIGDWSKDQIVAFAWQIHRLTDQALAARDEGAVDKIVQRITAQPVMEREHSAAQGGSLLARGELDDDCPF